MILAQLALTRRPKSPQSAPTLLDGRARPPAFLVTDPRSSVGRQEAVFVAGSPRVVDADPSAAQAALRYASIHFAHPQREPETALPGRPVLWSDRRSSSFPGRRFACGRAGRTCSSPRLATTPTATSMSPRPWPTGHRPCWPSGSCRPAASRSASCRIAAWRSPGSAGLGRSSEPATQGDRRSRHQRQDEYELADPRHS